MCRFSKKCSWLLLAVIFLLHIPSFSYAEEGDQPALEIAYWTYDAREGRYVFPLDIFKNGTWQWIQVPEEAPLTSLAISYSPAWEGYLTVTSPANYVELIGTHVGMMDYSASESAPMPFVVTSVQDGISQVWSGWITVSHQPRPWDLPAMPVVTFIPTLEPAPTLEPVTKAPVTEPPVTVEPYTLPPVTSQPTPAPTIPPRQTGYAVVTSSYATLRDMPGGNVRAELKFGEVLYVNGQQQDIFGGVWHSVTVMDEGRAGYIDAASVRFMTEQEVYDYLHRPTARPTARPTSVPATGYARVAWQSTALNNWPGNTAPLSQTLYQNDVVYVLNQITTEEDALWYAARAENGKYGYLMTAAVTMMTPTEVDAYLASLVPKPTLAPTLNPNETYAVVKMNNVNFRDEPNGSTLRRVHSGTIARVLSDAIYRDQYNWYFVEVGGDVGYLREDMIDFIQVRPAPTPSPMPTAVPTPTPLVTLAPQPSPAPTLAPLPPAGPLTVFDRLRAAVDTARYIEFAKRKPDAVSWVVRDFDGDRQMELLLIEHFVRTDASRVISLAAYKLADGEMKMMGFLWEITPVLQRGTELEIVLLEQDGRIVVYAAQHETPTGKVIAGEGKTLTQDGWIPVQLAALASNPEEILAAKADILMGKIEFTLTSGIGQNTLDEVDSASLSAIIRVFLQLFEGGAEGNG